MKPQIGITESHLQKSNAFLSSILANEMTLYIKLRKFHWNVAGENFMELHKLFEGQYRQLEESIDEIAERISKLGGKTIGTMKEFSELTILKESPNHYPSPKEMKKELLDDHETVIVQLRKDIDLCADENKDAGTADFSERGGVAKRSARDLGAVDSGDGQPGGVDQRGDGDSVAELAGVRAGSAERRQSGFYELDSEPRYGGAADDHAARQLVGTGDAANLPRGQRAAGAGGRLGDSVAEYFEAHGGDAGGGAGRRDDRARGHHPGKPHVRAKPHPAAGRYSVRGGAVREHVAFDAADGADPAADAHRDSRHLRGADRHGGIPQQAA